MSVNVFAVGTKTRESIMYQKAVVFVPGAKMSLRQAYVLQVKNQSSYREAMRVRMKPARRTTLWRGTDSEPIGRSE